MGDQILPMKNNGLSSLSRLILSCWPLFSTLCSASCTKNISRVARKVKEQGDADTEMGVPHLHRELRHRILFRQYIHPGSQNSAERTHVGCQLRQGVNRKRSHQQGHLSPRRRPPSTSLGACATTACWSDSEQTRNSAARRHRPTRSHRSTNSCTRRWSE